MNKAVFLASNILVALVVLPVVASAEPVYFRGTETFESKKHKAKQKSPLAIPSTPVLMEIDVAPSKDKITQRVIRPAPGDPSSMQVATIEFKKQGSGWTWTDHNNSPPQAATVTLRGDSLESIAWTFLRPKMKFVGLLEIKNRIALNSVVKTKSPKDKEFSSTTVDAGLILKNQWDNSLKGKKLVPRPPPAVPKAPGK